jgi:hypothetical protein
MTVFDRHSSWKSVRTLRTFSLVSCFLDRTPVHFKQYGLGESIVLWNVIAKYPFVLYDTMQYGTGWFSKSNLKCLEGLWGSKNVTHWHLICTTHSTDESIIYHICTKNKNMYTVLHKCRHKTVWTKNQNSNLCTSIGARPEFSKISSSLISPNVLDENRGLSTI